MKNKRPEELRELYKLTRHPEGGSFAEVYTAPFAHNNRQSAGSIYFLLEGGDISHFHQIDCDELWFYHEGCGLVITVLDDKGMSKYLLGPDIQNGQNFSVVIPKGAIFAAENIVKDEENFTFVSCVTTPKFIYEGFRLINKSGIRAKYPDIADEIEYLAY